MKKSLRTWELTSFNMKEEGFFRIWDPKLRRLHFPHLQILHFRPRQTFRYHYPNLFMDIFNLIQINTIIMISLARKSPGWAPLLTPYIYFSINFRSFSLHFQNFQICCLHRYFLRHCYHYHQLYYLKFCFK